MSTYIRTRFIFLNQVGLDPPWIAKTRLSVLSTVGPLHSRYPSRRNNEKGASLFLREDLVEPTQWAQWLAIIARSRHSAAYCRLRVNSSVRSHSHWKHGMACTRESRGLWSLRSLRSYVSNARSFPYRRSLFWKGKRGSRSCICLAENRWHANISMWVDQIRAALLRSLS